MVTVASDDGGVDNDSRHNGTHIMMVKELE
jgi:hypothetical protein